MHKGKSSLSTEKIQISFWAEIGLEESRGLAARDVIEDAGQTEAGWKLFPDVLHKICANFEEVMFRAFLTES